MPKFKAIIDGVDRGELDRLVARFPDFAYYAAMLTQVAQDLADGVITAPGDGDGERSFPWIAEQKFAQNYAALIKFVLHSDWEEPFEGVLEEHFGLAMDEFGLDDAGIGEAIGDDWTTALWLAALDDLATRSFDIGDDGAPEIVNVVDALFGNGRKLAGPVKLYLRALCVSAMSLYEVTDVRPGVSLRARDLMRGGEPVLVHERSGTASLVQWDRIGARILTVAGRNVLAAGVLKYNFEGAQALLDGFRQAEGKAGTDAPLSITTDSLRELAHMFSTAWLYDVVPKATGIVPPPAVTNSDGDEVVFHRVRFPLIAGTTSAAITAKLEKCGELRRESPETWIWTGASERPGTPSSPARRTVSGHAATADGTPILGHVVLLRDALTISVTSAARAERAAVLFEQLLGEFAGVPLSVIETLDQARAAQDRAGSVIPPAAVPVEVAAPLVHAMLDRHYRATLDHPVPMLGDVTPRDAARTAAVRIRVVEWLKYIENTSGSTALNDMPMASYDYGWIWRELGVEDLRR